MEKNELICNLCGAPMEHFEHNDTFIWSCTECANIQFEYYNIKDYKELGNYLEINKHNSKKNYESLCIFDPNTLLADYERVINDIKEITTIHEFNIVGVKKLAYVIKGFNSGFFVTFKYSLTDEELHKIILKLKDNNNIIKFINIEDKGDN